MGANLSDRNSWIRLSGVLFLLLQRRVIIHPRVSEPRSFQIPINKCFPEPLSHSLSLSLLLAETHSCRGWSRVNSPLLMKNIPTPPTL